MIAINISGTTYETNPVWARYSNGRIALELIDAETAEPIIRVSINLVDEPMEADEMAINHDFADVVEDTLVAAGLIEACHRTVKPRGSWVDFRICRVIGGPQS